MIAGARVVVVVPALNEEAHIGQVVLTMPAFVDHVIVVDDGSRDRTGAVALEAGGARVQVVRHEAPRGVGAAILSGYLEGLGLTSGDQDVLAVMAGDGQMHPDDLEAVVLPVAKGLADYVKGDRFGFPGIRGTMGFPRWLGGQVFSRLTSLAVGQRISDSQCGFTALSRGAALALDLRGMWPSFGYPNDLLGTLAAYRMRIREVAVRPVYGTEESKLRLRHLPPIFFLIGRAALRRRAAPVTPTGDTPRTGLRGTDAVSS